MNRLPYPAVPVQITGAVQAAPRVEVLTTIHFPGTLALVMFVDLAYGKSKLRVAFPADLTTVVEPSSNPGLTDERNAVLAALQNPIGTQPLSAWISPGQNVCIVFTDITRATPNERLIPWLLQYLEGHGVARSAVTLLNALGTHRPNTRQELETLLTPEVVRNYRVLNHEPENPAALVQVGVTRDGSPAVLNRHFVEAGLRIVTGFIEPHFFAGFSGGPKGIMPGVAELRTVMHNHGPALIASPNAAFACIEGNPIWEEMRDIALMAGQSFLLNVTLNHQRQITGVFAGDLIQAHAAGCRFVKASAMQGCETAFDVVVSTNSGYPLDLNLYQGVKGMSAASRILRSGGTLILACECSDGVPAGSRYERMLASASGPEELLRNILSTDSIQPEQWQVQIQALIQSRARVLLYSSLAPAAVRAAHLTPCEDIATTVAGLVAEGAKRIAVLPQGPLTVPYLTNSALTAS